MFVSSWNADLFEEASYCDGHVKAVSSCSFIVSDVDIAELFYKGGDVSAAFGFIFDVGELFGFMVDVAVTEGDGDETSEEDVAFYAFREARVVNATDFKAVGVASKSGNKELNLVEVLGAGFYKKFETCTNEVGAEATDVAEDGFGVFGGSGVVGDLLDETAQPRICCIEVVSGLVHEVVFGVGGVEVEVFVVEEGEPVCRVDAVVVKVEGVVVDSDADTGVGEVVKGDALVK